MLSSGYRLKIFMGVEKTAFPPFFEHFRLIKNGPNFPQ
jgi:hypothetical protein